MPPWGVRPREVTTYRVEVTREDIDRGVRWQCEHCPIALAVERAIPGGTVYATLLYIMVRFPDGRCLTCDTPEVAAEFMRTFDRGDGFPRRPFAFNLVMERSPSPPRSFLDAHAKN